MKLFQAGLLLALSVAACAAPPPPPPPRPAVTPDQVEGLYRGTSTRFQADTRGCPSPGLVTLHVTAGQFFYRWTYKIQVPALIQPDGSVQGQLDDITLTGQVSLPQPAQNGQAAMPARIVGDVSNAGCGIHFTVSKRG